jgi:predicted nucleic acid-binding protein
VYLDASALVKLVAPEEETGALAAYLAEHRSQATSVIGLVEVRRAVARRPGVARERVEDVLGRISAIDLDPATVGAAGSIGPAELRTLDAIHLASAAALGDDLEAVVTYDRRMADAARALEMPDVAPAT